MLKVTLALFTIILAAVCAVPQTTGLRVLEKESKAIFEDGKAEIRFAVDNPDQAVDVRIKVEILNSKNETYAVSEIDSRITNGAQMLSVPMTLNGKPDPLFAWSRLKYEIARQSDGKSIASGLISISEIATELFDLRVWVSPEWPGKPLIVNVYAFDSRTLAPVEGVAVTANEGNVSSADTATLRTDQRGFVAITIPANSTNWTGVTVTGVKSAFMRTAWSRIERSDSRSTLIATDKPIYQPGQTVNARINLVDFRSKPIAKTRVELRIKSDYEDETVYSTQVETSRFGIASVSWKIPESARLGIYSIVADDGNQRRTARFKISRYDLPNFGVDVRSDKAYYLPDETSARIEVNAKYLFGKPLAFAKVSVEEVGSDVRPHIEGTTDADGRFTSDLDLSGHGAKLIWRNLQFDDLRFVATVTDPTTGRSESRTLKIRITRNRINLYLINFNTIRSPMLPQEYFVSAFYADGTPAECEIGVFESIDRDSSGNRIPPEPGARIASLRTGKYGAGRFTVDRKGDTSDIDVLLIAQDSAGETGRLNEELDFGSSAAINVATDKVIYAPGDPINVTVESSRPSGEVIVDILGSGKLVHSSFHRLVNGRFSVTVPYSKEFVNRVTVVAYTDDDDDGLISATSPVIYPAFPYLKLEAQTEKEEFRPGEDVRLRLRSNGPNGDVRQTALGIVVVDGAVENRALSEFESNPAENFLNRRFSDLADEIVSRGPVFGNLTAEAIFGIDAKQPVSEDLSTAVRIALGRVYHPLEFVRTRLRKSDLINAYESFFKQQTGPVHQAIDNAYKKSGELPTDPVPFMSLLEEAGIDLRSMRDPWGNPYRLTITARRDRYEIEILSAGPDKATETNDDLTAYISSYAYFDTFGKAIDKALADYLSKTGQYVTDIEQLREAMRGSGFDPDATRDPWGNLYRYEFTTDRGFFILTVTTNGPDGERNAIDDVVLWTHRFDYTAVTKAGLTDRFREGVKQRGAFPNSEAEVRDILRRFGNALERSQDPYGRPYFVERQTLKTTGDLYRRRAGKLKVIRKQLIRFKIQSAGMDGIPGNMDDFTLVDFTGATEGTESDVPANKSNERRAQRQSSIRANFGGLCGTVADPLGAVIPGASIELKDSAGNPVRTSSSGDRGEFFLSDLPPGTYSLTIAYRGFQTLEILGVLIEEGALLEIEPMLDVASVTSTVEVEAPGFLTVDQSSSMVATTVTQTSRPTPEDAQTKRTFTPRVRDRFDETLVWVPELITDPDGKAEYRFKMADNLTTWKMYVVGNDEEGNFGVVEKEIRSFQPFFAELDPPRILTEGDEISLPVPIRNYTEKTQNVDVSLAANDWSQPIRGNSRRIEVASNSTQNAVLGFRATKPVVDGKQRVTAVSKKDGDAIEKPVTVRANGAEVVRTFSNTISGTGALDVDFPSNTLPNTRKTIVKIYPNVFSHIAESVDGLLERPHGCGEQTTSSTYPNLLILRIEKQLGTAIDPSIRAAADANLRDGYKRLLSYQTDSGFGIWSGTNPDADLTAYVLRFLNDADEFIDVDQERVEMAEKWLVSVQNSDGSWNSNRSNKEVSTAYILRALSETAGTDPAKVTALQKGIEYLKGRLESIKSPFVLANFAIVARQRQETESATKAMAKLRVIAFDATGQNLTTPFGGWGDAARMESEAIAIQALLASGVSGDRDLASRLLSDVLKAKDRYGVWHSTQTTVAVLDAIAGFNIRSDKESTQVAELWINGKKIRDFALENKGLRNPIFFDASAWTTGEQNRLEVRMPETDVPIFINVAATHYVDWNDRPEESDEFDLKVAFDKTDASIGEWIGASVSIKPSTPRYAMGIAEIGLPPGADVDRQTLLNLRDSSKISSFDILPDRVVVYFSMSTPLEFVLKFRPRFAMKAQSAPSVVYDYYNDSARDTVPPTRFVVR